MSGSTSASRRNRHLHRALLETRDLRETALVAAAFERGLQPGANDEDGVLAGRGAPGEREHVEIVVLSRQARRLHVSTDRRSDAWSLVGADRHADTGSAHEHAALGFAA